jgi:hypothetical protein
MLTKGSCFHLFTYNVVTSRFPNLKASQIRKNFSTLWKRHSKNSLILNIKYAFDEYQKVTTMELVAIIKDLIYKLNLAHNGDKMKILDYWSLIERSIIPNLQTLVERWCKRSKKILNKLTSHWFLQGNTPKQV